MRLDLDQPILNHTLDLQIIHHVILNDLDRLQFINECLIHGMSSTQVANSKYRNFFKEWILIIDLATFENQRKALEISNLHLLSLASAVG